MDEWCLVFELVAWLLWVVDLLEPAVLFCNLCLTWMIFPSWCSPRNESFSVTSFRKLIIQVLPLGNQPVKELTELKLGFCLQSFKLYNFHGYSQ